MKKQSGNTAVEAVLMALVVVLVLAVGFWLGTDTGDDSKSTTTTVTSTETTEQTAPPATAPSGPSDFDPLSLAALSLATAPGQGSPGGIPGSQAAAVILAESGARQRQSAQRAAYWSSVGATIATLRDLEATAASLTTAEQVKQNRDPLEAIQAKALFVVGGLEQMQVEADPPKLGQSLIAGANSVIAQSIDLANSAQAASTAADGNKAAAKLSGDAATIDATLAGMQNLYDQALEAAGGGRYKKADELLGLLEQAAAELG